MLDINKIKTVEDCDKLILHTMQESYKMYLNGKFKDAQKLLAASNKLIKRSKALQIMEKNKKIIINRRKKAQEKKIAEEQTREEDNNTEHFKGITNER